MSKAGIGATLGVVVIGLGLCSCGGSTNDATRTVTRTVTVASANPAVTAATKTAPAGPNLIAEAIAHAQGKSTQPHSISGLEEQFVSCMRADGVPYHAPPSGKKKLISPTGGLDRSSPKYAAAHTKCKTQLTGKG